MEVDDAHISVRFKYGIHTIYLFVDTQAPFSDVTTELLELVQERYPSGLTPSVEAIELGEKREIPADATLAFGMLKNPNDPTKGWKKLNIGDGTSTPTKLGIKNNNLLAFAVVDDEDDEHVFEVDWPREEEEYEQTE